MRMEDPPSATGGDTMNDVTVTSWGQLQSLANSPDPYQRTVAVVHAQTYLEYFIKLSGISGNIRFALREFARRRVITDALEFVNLNELISLRNRVSHHKRMVSKNEADFVVRTIQLFLASQRADDLVRLERAVQDYERTARDIEEVRRSNPGVYLECPLDDEAVMFQRFYDEEIVLGRNNLKGAASSEIVKQVPSKALRISFEGERCLLTALPASISLSLGGVTLKPGEFIPVPASPTVLRIGPLSLLIRYDGKNV